MKNSKLWAAEALEDFPEELREKAVAYLLDQGEKFRILKQLVQEGIDDADAGRVSEWDPDEIWKMAEEIASQEQKIEEPREAGE